LQNWVNNVNLFTSGQTESTRTTFLRENHVFEGRRRAQTNFKMLAIRAHCAVIPNVVLCALRH